MGEISCVSIWSHNWAPLKELGSVFLITLSSGVTLITSPLRAFSSLGWAVPSQSLSTEKFQSLYHLCGPWLNFSSVYPCLSFTGSPDPDQCIRCDLTGAMGTASTCWHHAECIYYNRVPFGIVYHLQGLQCSSVLKGIQFSTLISWSYLEKEHILDPVMVGQTSASLARHTSLI